MHGDHHDHTSEHHDELNLRSAYVHVIADAATSVLTMVVLLGGGGWAWLDPLMGVVRAALAAVWAKGLIVQTGKMPLDCEMDHPVVGKIREVIRMDCDPGTTGLTDLYVWRVGEQVHSCALSVVTQDSAVTPQSIRQSIAVHEEIVHSIIEVHRVQPEAVLLGLLFIQ